MGNWSMGALLLGLTSLLASAWILPAQPEPPGTGFESASVPLVAEVPRPEIETAASLATEAFGEGNRGFDEPPNVLFVQVPDPVDSSLDWAYDSMLFSVRKAFECSGWVAHQRWLPWLEDRREIQRGQRYGLDLDPELRHRHPGVLLFRQAAPEADGSAEWFVVFVIGEDPLTGIHSRAFADALAQRQELGYADDDELYVVGPAFAGSADSVRRAIERFATRPDGSPGLRPEVHFISGSAMGNGADRLAELGSYHVTVHSEAERMTVLRNVLGQLDIDPSRVALLQESTTTIGRESFEPLESRNDAGLSKALIIPFPLSIANLRNTADLSQGGIWRPPTFRRASVPMPLGSTLRPGATATPQGISALTPAVVESIIDEIAQTLIHEGIRAVVISATDVRDTIFLGTELRSRIRGIRLFALRNNLLYLRPERQYALRGMVVVSTYPLVPTHRDPNIWKVPRQYLFFPNEMAEGIFNATTLTLDRMLEPRSPSDQSGSDPGTSGNPKLPRAVTYYTSEPPSWPATPPEAPAGDRSRWFRSVAPELWVSAVGTGAILPLRNCRDCEADDVSSDRAPRFGKPEISRVALFGVFLLGIVVLSHSWRFQWTRVGKARAIIQSRVGPLLHRLRRSWREVSENSGDSESSPGSAISEESEEPQAAFETEQPATDFDDQSSENPTPERTRTLLIRRFLCHFEQIYLMLFRGMLLALLLPHSAFLFYYCIRLLDPAPGPSLLYSNFFVLGVCLVAIGASALGLILELLCCADDLTKTLDRARQFPKEPGPFIEWWRREIRWQIVVLLFLFVFYFGAVLLYSWAVASNQLATAPSLVFFRAVQIENGVTPLLPLSIIGALTALWALWHAKRMERLTKETPFGIAMHEDRAGHQERKEPEERVRNNDNYQVIGFLANTALQMRERLFYINLPARDFLHLLWLGPTIFWLWVSFGTSYEALVLPAWVSLGFFGVPMKPLGVNAFDVVLRTGILLALLTSCATLYRFLAVAHGLRDFLKRLAATPLLTAFERLPKRISRLARLPLFAQPGSWIVKASSEQNRQYLDRVGEMLWKERPISTRPADSIERRIYDLHRSRSRCFERERSEVAENTGKRRQTEFEIRCDLSDLLGDLGKVLEQSWQEEPGECEGKQIIEHLREPESPTSDIVSVSSQVQRRFPPQSVGLWLRTAEELFALEIVGYVESVLKQLQRMILFLFPAILLTGALIGSYPFEPQGLMSTFFIAIVVFVVGAFVWVMVMFNSDEILNRLSHTDPRRFTWHGTLVLNLFLVLGVGLLALISTEYPAVWQIFLGWFQPLLEAIAG